jgi:hypothetical protein
MNPYLDLGQCRGLIAELAELLPRLLSEKNTGFSIALDEPDVLRRGRRDPVFTGGSVVGLLITDPAAPPPSRTKDIDIVLEIAGYGDFVALEHVLRQAGFTQPWEERASVVIWYWRGIRVDFLPHKPTAMMGTNRWFPYLIEEAERVEVLPGKYAWCASAPCFIATKLEAFFSRGRGDFLMSKDIEDILAVVDGREELFEEMKFTAPDVRGFVGASLMELLGDERFMDSIPQLVPDDSREVILIDRLKGVAALI